MRQLRQGVLGKAPIGRDLAAIDGEERRLAVTLVEHQGIVAADVLRLAGAVVIERAHAGIGPDHVGGADLGAEIFVDDAAEIFDLLAGRDHGRRIAGKSAIGGADQREVALEGNGEHDATVHRLQNIGAIMIVKFAHHDMRAFVEAEPVRRRGAQR